mgnify:CR=1 FL=1
MNYTITANTQFNSNEVYFSEKPSTVIITALKVLKMRWNNNKKCWYGFADAEAIKAACEGSEVEAVKVPTAASRKNTKKLASLWDRCDISTIPEHNRHESTKNVAQLTREHLKERFPEVKFSVRIGKGGWAANNEVLAYIVSSPYENKDFHSSRYTCTDKRGELQPLEAILNYLTAWVDSFNYNNSDYMTDYFDVNFYATTSIDYHYTQTETSEAVKADIADYEAKAAEWCKAYEEEQDRLFAERMAEMEKAQAEAEIREAQRQADAQAISENVQVVDLAEPEQFRLTGLLGGCGKEATLDELKESIAERIASPEEALITRKIIFTDSEAFKKFCGMFLYDFDFLNGKGGTATDDPRVTAENFYSLNEEQRETVKYYMTDCVAVYLNNKLYLVIDPEGYSYSRYVYIPSVDTETTEGHPEPEAQGNDFYFPAPVAMQSKNISVGDTVTIINIDEWTLCTQSKSVVVTGCHIARYAQYENALFVTCKSGRKEQTLWFHDGSDLAIFKGYLPDTPEYMRRRYTSSMMYEDLTSGIGSKKYIINAIEYYKAQGYKCLVDTIQR